MTENEKGVFGCMGMICVVVLIWGTIHFIGQGIEMMRDPKAYAERQRVALAEGAAEAEQRERDRENAKALKLAEDRALEAQIKADAVRRDRANRAALERYAECQVRNKTPGYCTEDWRPTDDIRAMKEIATEGRF